MSGTSDGDGHATVPPPPPPPPTDGGAGPTSSGRGGGRRWWAVAGTIVLVLIVGAAVLVLGGGEAQAQVLLEPIGTAADDAFTDPVAPEPSGSLHDYAEDEDDATPTPEPDETTGDPETGEDVEDAATEAAARYGSASGGDPGLYGGSLDESSCDVEQLIAFLESDAEKGAAWAEVQGIEAGELRPFIEGLTPVHLGEDTRVTNHGFADGDATPRQSVLQRGTAVLVDDRGVPRANCYCGNPLVEPTVTGDESYTGEAWETFEAAEVIVVDDAPEPLDTFELVDIETGERFERPAGTAGAADEAPRKPEPDTDDATEAPAVITAEGALDYSEVPTEVTVARNEIALEFPAAGGPVRGTGGLLFVFSTAGGSGEVAFDFTIDGTYDGEDTLTGTIAATATGTAAGQTFLGDSSTGEMTATVDREAGTVTGTLSGEGGSVAFSAEF